MTNLNSQMDEFFNGFRSEISISTDGKGSITKNGLCVLLGISRSSFSAPKLSAKLVQKLTVLGFECAPFFPSGHIPDLAVACIVKYYAYSANTESANAVALDEAFSAIGIRAWFQDVTGYSQPIQKTPEQAFEELVDMARLMGKVTLYASDKPGQAHTEPLLTP